MMGLGVQARGPLAEQETMPVKTLHCAFACAAKAP